MRILMTAVVLVLALPMQAGAQQSPGDDAVVQWTAKAMTDIMSFDFDNYDKKKEQNRKYFTQHGYEDYYDAMDRARIPQMVTMTRQAADLKVTCARESSEPVVKDGVKSWAVKMPVVMTYHKGDKSREDLLVMNIVVHESKDPLNTDGLAIDQSIAVPMDLGEDARICGTSAPPKDAGKAL